MQLIVGGAHLDATYGRTREEIVADGFDIATEISAGLGKDTARAIGEGVVAVADVLDALKPDVLVVYGDRFDAFAAFIAATQSNIPVMHRKGGDRTEGCALDDSVRHAITKLAHIHLVTKSDAAWRIGAMGEELWRNSYHWIAGDRQDKGGRLSVCRRGCSGPWVGFEPSGHFVHTTRDCN